VCVPLSVSAWALCVRAQDTRAQKAPDPPPPPHLDTTNKPLEASNTNQRPAFNPQLPPFTPPHPTIHTHTHTHTPGKFPLAYSFHNPIVSVFASKAFGAFDVCQTPQLYSYNAVSTHFCTLGQDVSRSLFLFLVVAFFFVLGVCVWVE
jgi:hypothetical protein